MLGLAVALTSCSDDKYEPTNKMTGAYFAGSQAANLAFSNEETSYTLKVYRTENSPTTYAVNSTDPSGLFGIPTSVTFDANQYETDLVITYDPNETVDGKEYPVTIVLGDEVYVGRNAMNFIFVVDVPLVTETFLDGTGSYYYNIIWSGDDPDLPITITSTEKNPRSVVWTIGNYGDPEVEEDDQIGPMYGINLNITSENYDPEGEKDCVIRVPLQYTLYDNATYGQVWVSDYASFKESLGGVPTAAEANASTYSPKSGVFSINAIYSIPTYGEGNSYLNSVSYEYFEMDGFPDNETTVEYQGLFTDRYGDMSAQATVYTGSDVTSAKAVMVAGNDADAGYQAIVNGEEGVIDVPVTGDATISFPVTQGGTYTIVVVSYIGEDEARIVSDTFDITIGSVQPEDDPDWPTIGEAGFADGWVTAGYTMGGVPLDVIDYMWSVEVQQYIGTDPVDGTAYRLVNPYGDNSWLTQAGYNSSRFANKRTVQFNVSGDFGGMPPQACGYEDEDDADFDEWYIGDQIGMFMMNYPYDGQSGYNIAFFANYLTAQGATNLLTDYSDGVLMFNKPFFGGDADEDFGYAWRDGQPSMIVLPSAESSVVAKARAARVAAPKLTGLKKVHAAKAKARQPQTVPGKKLVFKDALPCKNLNVKVINRKNNF